jgi:hypothetical protein
MRGLLRHGSCALLLSSLPACAHAGLPDAAAVSIEAPGKPLPREADGVFLDLPTARPEPRVIATAGGVVSLSLPVSPDEVQTLVRAYFRAFVSGDASAFGTLLAHGARQLAEGSSAELSTALERRLRAVDYSHLSFESLAAYDEVRVVPFDVAPEARRVSDWMREGDVLVEVPVRVQEVGVVRVFGPKVVLLLRRADGLGPWQIAAVRETDGPWT